MKEQRNHLCKEYFRVGSQHRQTLLGNFATLARLKRQDRLSSSAVRGHLRTVRLAMSALPCCVQYQWHVYSNTARQKERRRQKATAVGDGDNDSDGDSDGDGSGAAAA